MYYHDVYSADGDNIPGPPRGLRAGLTKGLKQTNLQFGEGLRGLKANKIIIFWRRRRAGAAETEGARRDLRIGKFSCRTDHMRPKTD